ncbi:MAG: alpha/beta fold hydrolase, partial [Planctomycetes bacterium]|nr:alpha/beta fold hydrolase [Planctomycetota bacterium]
MPITLRTMGALFFGGTVSTRPDGETFHGDHGYAQYYIPWNSRQYPWILWHGIGQSGKTYESTPDGREGFQAIMTRRDWPVYIIDQPRRGRAGRTEATLHNAPVVPTVLRESAAFDAFRLGYWVPPKAPEFFPNIQLPTDPTSLDQFFRQQTPDTGEEPRTPEYREWMGRTMAKLFSMTGPAILVTHSNSGQYGWETVMSAPDLVKAIVAYEPGAMAFPEGERPADIPWKAEGVEAAMEPRMVPLERFLELTKMPILIIYGDNIATEPSEIFNADVWRMASTRARQFVETVNRHGGDATLVLLPEIGIEGNTHIPFADRNNLDIADHLE